MGVDTEKIKNLREKKKMTMEEAATAAGFKNRQRWNDVESGRRANPRIDTLVAVAKALGVEMTALMKK